MQPYFSVIIPSYNRPEQVLRCLQAIARQTYARDSFEVIVVNDGGTPVSPSAELRQQLRLTLLDQPHGGPAAARNRGAEAAQGAVLAFTDDDCEPAPDWLSSMAAGAAAAPGCALGGLTINRLSHNRYSTASQLLIDYLYRYYNRSASQAQFFAANNLAVPAERFRQLGGFNQAYRHGAGEDRELCRRWRQAGYGMVYLPEAIIYHAHHLKLRSFWRQHFTYGKGALQFVQAPPGTAKQGQRAPLSFYMNLLLYPLRQDGWRALPLLLLLLLAQLATVSGYLAEALAQRREARA